MAKLKWGVKAAAEEMDDQGFYDGQVPPKGRYICAIKRLQVKETQNGDNRFNGLLEIRDPRKGKSQFNGYGFWFGVNVTPKSVRFVTNFIKQGLGVPFKDLGDLDRLVDLDSTELPANVKKIGRVVFGDGKEPLIVVNAKRRRANDDPEGDWELTTDDFAPAFPGIDPKKLANEDGAADEDDEDDADDMFEDDEDDADEDEDLDEEEDDEEEDEDELTREELQEMGLPELRELAVEVGVMTKARAAKAKKSALVDALAPEDEDEDEDEDEEPEDEDEPEEDEEEQAPPPRKSTRRSATKSASAKSTTRRRR